MFPRLAPSLPLDSSEMGLFSNGFLRSGVVTGHGKAGGIKWAGGKWAEERQTCFTCSNPNLMARKLIDKCDAVRRNLTLA